MRIHTNTITGTNRFHSNCCSQVREYPDNHEMKNMSPEEFRKGFDQRCLLCKLGVTGTDMQEFDPTERALDIFEHFLDRNDAEIEGGTHLKTPPVTYGGVLDALRRLISVCQAGIQEEGFLEENTGVSVKGRGYWKQKRRDSHDSTYFRCVPHGVAVCMIFDIIHSKARGYESLDDYLESVSSDGNRCDKNMAQTYSWLKGINQTPHAERLDAAINRYHTLEINSETSEEGLFPHRAHGGTPEDEDQEGSQEDENKTSSSEASLDEFSSDGASESDQEKPESPASPSEQQTETTTATLDSF